MLHIIFPMRISILAIQLLFLMRLDAHILEQDYLLIQIRILSQTSNSEGVHQMAKVALLNAQEEAPHSISSDAHSRDAM